MNVITPLRIFSILFIFILFSCFPKKRIIEENLINKAIEDFILSYSKEKYSKDLKGIIIYLDDDTLNIFISDAPYEVIGSLNNNDNILIGRYKDVFFEAYGNHKIISENRYFQIYTTNEIEKLSPRISLEYEPKLEIIYDFKKLTKLIKKGAQTYTEEWRW